MTVRYPRVWLSINGAQIPCISGHATRKAQRSCDEFSATLSLTESARYGMDIAAWADFQSTDAALIMSTTAGDQRTVVSGVADEPGLQLLANTVTVRGRDKSSKLTNKKVNKKYLNKTASDIVKDIAQDAGLQAQTQDSGDNAGKTFVEDTAHLVADKSPFAAISGLAEREGFRWYVDGDTIYFEPDENADNGYQVRYTPPLPGEPASGNILDLTLGRNMNAARPHKVTVKSWHERDKKIYTSEASSDGVGDQVSYEHHHNGHKQAQVEKIARSRLKNAIRHELMIGIRMVGDLSLDVRQKLTLSGTGTIYDQGYDVDEIGFDISWGSAFTMTVNCNSPKQGRSTQ